MVCIVTAVGGCYESPPTAPGRQALGEQYVDAMRHDPIFRISVPGAHAEQLIWVAPNVSRAHPLGASASRVWRFPSPPDPAVVLRALHDAHGSDPPPATLYCGGGGLIVNWSRPLSPLPASALFSYAPNDLGSPAIRIELSGSISETNPLATAPPSTVVTQYYNCDPGVIAQVRQATA